jgi:serine/threonine protein phosphatase 1
MTGDYLDRGPDSRGVLELLTSPRMRDFDPVFLAGNHDLAVISVVQNRQCSDWLFHGGNATMRSYGIGTDGDPNESVRAFAHQFPEHHLRFLRELRTSHVEDETLFCHAGIDPGSKSALAPQDPNVLIYGDPDFLTPHPAWKGRVVHGHWVAKEVHVSEKRIGIDTGCGFPGGKLSSIAIDAVTGEVRILGERR